MYRDMWSQIGLAQASCQGGSGPLALGSDMAAQHCPLMKILMQDYASASQKPDGGRKIMEKPEMGCDQKRLKFVPLPFFFLLSLSSLYLSISL